MKPTVNSLYTRSPTIHSFREQLYFTVSHCTILYRVILLHCTPLNHTVQSDSTPLQSIGQHCTYSLTITVPHCTPVHDKLPSTASDCTRTVGGKLRYPNSFNAFKKKFHLFPCNLY